MLYQCLILHLLNWRAHDAQTASFFGENDFSLSGFNVPNMSLDIRNESLWSLCEESDFYMIQRFLKIISYNSKILAKTWFLLIL